MEDIESEMNQFGEDEDESTDKDIADELNEVYENASTKSDVSEEGEVKDLRQYKEDLESRDKKSIISKGEYVATGQYKENAATYGIYFEDQNKYNYLQHLKPIGKECNNDDHENGAATTLIESKSAQTKDAFKKKAIAFVVNGLKIAYHIHTIHTTFILYSYYIHTIHTIFIPQ